MDKGYYYNKIAPSYNGLHKSEQQRKLKQLSDHLILQPFDFFLDVGCGTGVSFPFLKCAYKFGLDPASELLKRVDDPTAKGAVVNGQGERLPFRSSSFDIVLCLTAFHNFDNPVDGIAEMRRVCKPQGKIIITILKKLKATDSLCELIRSSLSVSEFMEEYHDYMFVCINSDPKVENTQKEE